MYKDFYLVANNSTSAQNGTIHIGCSQSGVDGITAPDIAIQTDTGSATENSTGALTLAITVQFNNSGTGDELTITNVIGSIIK